MEYTMLELKEMLNYMDAQLKDQGRIVDDRLLTRRKNVAQAVANLEAAEELQRDMGNRREGKTWGSL